MGIKLIILMALLVGVLYSLHLLVKDYQALSAGSRLLRMLFKRDTSSQFYPKPTVRWKTILLYDPIQCGRYFYCELGAQPASNEVRQGFIHMLKLTPSEENKSAHAIFEAAYKSGKMHPKDCRTKFPMCIFDQSLLFDLVEYLLHQPNLNRI